MIEAIGITQYTSRITPKPLKRVAPIEPKAEVSIEYKSGTQPHECCVDNWARMNTIMYMRKSTLKECPDCGRCFEVKNV